MSRWIDIDDISLLKTVSAGGLSAKALWRLIRQQPSIDLVFCGECKRKRLCDSVDSVDDWNYCYWGERKETEPTISKMEQVDKDTNVRSKAVYDKWGNVFDARADIEDEPQTMDMLAIDMAVAKCKAQHNNCKNCDKKCIWRGKP